MEQSASPAMQDVLDYMNSTDQEWQKLNIKDLKKEITEHPNNNNTPDGTVRHEVGQLLNNLQIYLEGQSFCGEFHPTGSTSSNSGIPKNLDFDFSFEYSGLPAFTLTPLGDRYTDLYKGKGSTTAHTLQKQFKKHITKAITCLSLGKLEFAGYGKPRANGLRRNGPAITLLVQHSSTGQQSLPGDKVITLDLTLGLPAPRKIQDQIVNTLESFPVWTSHIQSLPVEKRTIHVVPAYKPTTKIHLWLLSTAVLETHLLSSLDINKTVRAIKLLGSALSLKSSDGQYSELVGFDDRVIKIHNQLSGRARKNELERQQLGCSLFDKHLLLPGYLEPTYFEKTKEIISVSGAAVKFFVLRELADGKHKSIDQISWPTVHRFFASLIPEIESTLKKIEVKQPKRVERQETPLSEPCVEHPFLSQRVRKLNFANYAVVNKEIVCTFGNAFKDRFTMEIKETDSLYKDLSSGFYIPGYSADVIDFPSSDTDEYSTSDSDDKELCQDFHENHDLFKVLSSGFHIPGYSADVIDFPSSGTDECSSSDSENGKQGQDLHKDLSLSDSENDEQSHDLYKALSSGFHIPGYSADVIDFPSSDTDQYSSSHPENEEQEQDLHKNLSPNDSENEQQSHDLYNVLSSGFHIPGYSADVIDFPSSGSDGSSSSDSDSEIQIQSSCSKYITEFPGEKSEKYKHCSIADAGDVFPDTSWQDSPKTKIPPIPMRGADFRDISWRELGLEVASSESSRWEKYLYHSWRVFADADSLKTGLLKTDADDDGISELESLRTESDFTEDQVKPPLFESSYSATVKPKTVIESGEVMRIKPGKQRYEEKGQDLVTEKLEGTTWYDIEPKSDEPQGFGTLLGVGVLGDKKMVVSDLFENCLHVFSTEGHYITSHHLSLACDLAGTPDGGMVAVNHYTLHKLDKQGHELWNVEKSQLQNTNYKGFDDYISGVCVDSQGLIYTRLRHSVCVVDNDGHILKHIEDSIPNSVWYYCGIAVQPWGDILLPDPHNNCVVVLSESGEHKATLGGPHPQEGGLSYPCGIAVDSTGNVAVTSRGGDTVTVYSPAAECISTLGVEDKKPGMFSCPTGITFTPYGDIIVCDEGNKRIQIFQLPTFMEVHQRQTTPDKLLGTDSPPHYSSPPEKPQRHTIPVYQVIN